MNFRVREMKKEIMEFKYNTNHSMIGIKYNTMYQWEIISNKSIKSVIKTIENQAHNNY